MELDVNGIPTVSIDIGAVFLLAYSAQMRCAIDSEDRGCFSVGINGNGNNIKVVIDGPVNRQ